MFEPSDKIVFIADSKETYINKNIQFENAQKRVLYDMVVDYVGPIQITDNFQDMLKTIYNFIKGSMPLSDRAKSKLRIITIMTDNIFRTFEIEKEKGLKIQLDPDYDENIVQFCEELAAYEFDDITTSIQQEISDYSFLDFKINRIISFILAIYTDTMYKFALYLYDQYKIDPNTHASNLRKLQPKLDDRNPRSFDFLMELDVDTIYIDYDFCSIFLDEIDVNGIKNWLSSNLKSDEINTIYVNYSTESIICCIEDIVLQSVQKEEGLSDINKLYTLHGTEAAYRVKKLYDLLASSLKYGAIMLCNRRFLRYEQFFVFLEDNVTEESFPAWRDTNFYLENRVEELNDFLDIIFD